MKCAYNFPPFYTYTILKNGKYKVLEPFGYKIYNEHDFNLRFRIVSDEEDKERNKLLIEVISNSIKQKQL